MIRDHYTANYCDLFTCSDAENKARDVVREIQKEVD